MKNQNWEARQKNGVQLFSDRMIMKFRPKNSLPELTHNQSNSHQPSKVRNLNQIKFLEQASKDSVIIGNSAQLDLINIDGLSHNFVDTFYYWSISLNTPILNVKVNLKKEVLLILTNRFVQLYGYNTLKQEKSEPIFLSSFELQNQVKFIQFPTSDLIAIFYDHHFEIYSLNDSYEVSKKMQKFYGLSDRMSLFSVPQAIDHTINVFMQESQQKKNTFGLWCIQIRLLSDNIKINPIYKIYDIMKGLKRMLLLENYSSDIIFLNLGQEILVARKGYIVDSVNINLQVGNSYLKYLPRRQVLVHIEKNSVDLYSFKINLNSVPHRIQLTSLDSLQAPTHNQESRLISALPLRDHNFALFFEDSGSHLTTRGEAFYSFVVSYTVDEGEKVSMILKGIEGNLSQLSEDELERKCDILRKMGLSNQQIYQQIWRRSSRSSVKDFQYLLATRDYRTIKGEIEAKLKKQSMSFKEVYKIEESCLSILKPKIQDENCNEELLKDYLTCSLLLRKLSLYRDLHILSSPQEKLLSINIQEYSVLKNMELKELILERLGLFLAGKISTLSIRLVLNHFRFVYRYIYQELLEQIIKKAKNELKFVLEAIPELLPIDVQKINKLEGTQEAIYQGMWSSISEEEWESGQHLEKISNVNNRQVVEQFVLGLWFKRNWLTAHDLIAKSRTEIENINYSHNSMEIFYFFIDCTVKNIKDPVLLKSVLSFMEKTYDQLPQHLRHKILLYCKLYRYYSDNWEAGQCPHFTFSQFLRLRDYHLFKYFFDLQRVKKNSLLREVKPIYEEVCGAQGFTIFNNGLLSYFQWEQSQISHLKCLLNRINNEKKEFHLAHEKMYEVLITAMQFKLRIGGSADIPIDEVLIYLENIPISTNNTPVIQQLQLIQSISEESLLFRKMRLNMTIREIIDNNEIVIQRLIDFKITQNRLFTVDSPTALSRTYRILAEVQSIKENIYGDDYNELVIFIFLTKLLEQEAKIPLVKDILSDKYLNTYYFIDTKIIESLVLYMYRWNFAKNPSFPASASYIRHLMQLLPTDNNFREYLEQQLEFALLLSTPANPVTYPIVTENNYPTIIDLQDILSCVDNDHIIRINITKVADAMRQMEELSHSMSLLKRNSTLNKSSVSSQKIQEDAVFKTFINIFISRKLIREAVLLIKKLMKDAEKSQVISILILLYNLLPDINEQSKNTLIRISSLLYAQPLKLINIIEQLISTKFTGLQSINYLHRQLDAIPHVQLNFNEENTMFSVYFLHLKEERIKKKGLLSNTLAKMKKVKPEFEHEFIYDIIFVILCYEPYNIAIFLKHIKPSKWKCIPKFINCLIQEEIFNQVNVLQLFRRVFYLILLSYNKKLDIYRLASQYNHSILEDFKINIDERQKFTELQKKIEKIAIAFEKKKNKVLIQSRSASHSHRNQQKKHTNSDNQQKKHTNSDKQCPIQKSTQELLNYKEESVKQFQFSDSEEYYEEDSQEKLQQEVKAIRHQPIKFNPKDQRKHFIRNGLKNNQIKKSSTQKDQIASSNQYRHQLNEFNEFTQQLNKNKSKNKRRSRLHGGSETEMGPGDEQYFKSPQRSKSAEKNRKNSPAMAPNVTSPHLPTQKNLEVQSINFKEEFQNAKIIDQLKSDIQIEGGIELPILQLENKASEKENLEKIKNNDAKQNLEAKVISIVKKIYRTYDEKLENEPYNLKVLFTQKQKSSLNDYIQLFNKIAQQVYEHPEKTQQIAFKLLAQIGGAFPQLHINIQNVGIFQQIAKFENKYGLDLPIDIILPYQAIYLNNKTSDELFQYLKDKIMQVCEYDNIFKLSKLISIAFKKNSLEQEIILLFLHRLIQQMNKAYNGQELTQGLEKIKGLVMKLHVRTLAQKTEKLVDLCTNMDLRPKIVTLLVNTMRIKGNGKDAQQLGNKLK